MLSMLCFLVKIKWFFSYKPTWSKLTGTDEKIDPHDKSLSFSPSEQEQMLALPRKNYKLTEKEKGPVFFTLLDILYGFGFDDRINLGDPGSESGWCIAKLSPTLSSCTKHSSLKQTLISCIRRLVVKYLIMDTFNETYFVDCIDKNFIFFCLKAFFRLFT